MITGRTMKASVNQPASIEMFQPKKWTNSATPKRPKTIEGTPARLMMASRIALMTAPCLLYSLR